ncbi:glycoside hydrolase family 26 protein [Paenibacillus sp. HWE-109]|uniref:glycosyl hydrolase n=1 Tax=Paenibacillus sp. HWE-109 TaxID=1306526 RepID=UPI001EDFE499|nr:glycosyl hydrolase [Paenibacillus sp. HWE-109]UKS26946.1 glycoside hydrolase family 26 protein [Paenibacillus sp. HWE-109]
MLKKWKSKLLAATLLVSLLASGSQGMGGTKAYAASPVNPGATQAVKDVLNYMDTVQANNQIISGQYVRGQNYGYMETDHIYNLTGKYPAMIGFDFYYNVTDASDLSHWRSFVVDHATEYWKKGGLVTISWHETNPLDTIADAGGWNSVNSSMSQADFNSLTTPGTPLYNKWLAHIDTMAGYLKSLRDQGVVVLWRPYHEMNIGFWWGGKTGASYKKLWENMYDRYTNYHGLNNLIWVWAPARDDNNAVNSNYYPGPSYVDLGGADIYADVSGNAKFANANNELASVMGNKRYGLSEVGLLPTQSAVQTTFDYTWFLVWAIGWADNLFYGYPANGPGNNTYSITPFYNNAITITRDEVPSFGRTIAQETIIFKDAMNGYSAAGVSPSNWTTVTTGGTVTVENVPSVGLNTGPDRSMKLNKTSTTNATTAEKSFTPQTGVVTFKATLRTEDASWKDFIIYDSSNLAALHAGLQGNYLKVYDGSTLMSIEPITASKWYDIKAVMNTTTKKFDLYVNGAKQANQFSFKNTAAVDVSRLKVGVAPDAAGIYYMDNVFITR